LPKEIRKNINIIPIGMEEIEWQNEFDYVISISVVEHINFPIIRAGMIKAMQALKPKGKMLLTIDQKITKDAGDTYIPESMYHYYLNSNIYAPLSKYYEDIILSLKQYPETTLSYHEDIDKPAGIYLNLKDYVKNNPDKWSKDFPEFLHKPYGLEFIKKERENNYDISKGYTEDIWEFHTNKKYYKVKRVKVSDIAKQYNLDRVIEDERLAYGYFWSQQKLNNIMLDLELGKRINVIALEQKNNSLVMADGFHRLYIIRKLFGENITILVGVKNEQV